MSPSPTQQWIRRIRYFDQHIRVSDADRNAVAELLGQHYADGRLDQAEFDERVGRTMTAKTRGDLAGLFDDLPDTGHQGAGHVDRGNGSAPSRRGPRRRGRLARPLLLLFLVFICANVAWHAFTASLFFVQPLLWAFAVVAVILLVNRSARRHDR
ncbi:MAG: DUF1707 SHOCT-like domain-containing protein [Trebonia sp.]